MFITTKVWNEDRGNVIQSARESLKRLQLDYVDLLLIHWPIDIAFGINPETNERFSVEYPRIPLHVAWTLMEKTVEMGLAKSIGVSNFNFQLLYDLLSYCHIKPVCNQIEIHPYNAQQDLVDWLKKEEIVPFAFCPIGNPFLCKLVNIPNCMDDALIKELAKKYNKSNAQILINWGLKRGHGMLVKSNSKDRIQENLDSFNFELD